MAADDEEVDDDLGVYRRDLHDPEHDRLIARLDAEIAAFWASPKADALEVLLRQEAGAAEALAALRKGRSTTADVQALSHRLAQPPIECAVTVNGKSARIVVLVEAPPAPLGNRIRVAILIEAGDLRGIRCLFEGVRTGSPGHSGLARALAELGINLQVQRSWFRYRGVRARIRRDAAGTLRIRPDLDAELTPDEQEQLKRAVKLIPLISEGRFSLGGRR